MPVMDGFQATQRIRELEKSRQEKKRARQQTPNNEPEPPPMPIIALTASATKVLAPTTILPALTPPA
jgi:CheY-like chemotaxis protein